jgi:AcrR family transcriptional regulator
VCTVSRVGATASEAVTATATGERAVDHWAERYLSADELERQLVAAAVACVGRWGLAKTSLDDIAREAGVSRATVYRVFPGGKDRLVATVVHHEIGRLFHEYDAAAKATTSLEDLLCVGVTIAMEALTGPPLRFLIRHEPQALTSVFAFERLTPLLHEVAALGAPHLSRFLPADQARPGAELVTRIVLSYSLSPSDMVRPSDPDSVRRFVRTYLVPALSVRSPT